MYEDSYYILVKRFPFLSALICEVIALNFEIIDLFCEVIALFYEVISLFCELIAHPANPPLQKKPHPK